MFSRASLQLPCGALRGLLFLAAGIALSAATTGCYSLSYGPSGYEKRGVWIPRGEAKSHAPKRNITVGELEMVFDEELRVYRIVDLPEHFYSAGNYYRFVDGYWQSARSPAGPWVETPQNRLPPSLTQAPSLTQGAPTS